VLGLYSDNDTARFIDVFDLERRDDSDAREPPGEHIALLERGLDDRQIAGRTPLRVHEPFG